MIHTISEAEIGQLSQELERTGLSSMGVRYRVLERTGIEIDALLIRQLAAGKKAQLLKEAWNALIATLASLPDKAPGTREHRKRVTLTEEMKAELERQIERTAYGPTEIAKRMAGIAPNLTAVKISNWRTGRRKTACPDEWKAMMDFLESYPGES
ncbi:hypothetical protein [Citromicrobium bathyomarinum]|uniref:hypothetical protein n=1 Tax=Citromicrobium bathyomarinum TaxID=72174 RepID=UPI001E3C37A2|nr:hypothetical protein [Citromicrobium bathyomarinum]MCD1624032.1 hypothetical protein [Citromicrobium bathyomarinum]